MIVAVLPPLPLNYANIIALPLLLGVGVSFNIYFVMNWRAGQTAVLGSPTARAILFSALTTGDRLRLAGPVGAIPGTASMGELLLISLGCTLVASLVFIPALLASVPDRRPLGLARICRQRSVAICILLVLPLTRGACGRGSRPTAPASQRRPKPCRCSSICGLPGVPKGIAGQVYADVPAPPPGGTLCTAARPAAHVLRVNRNVLADKDRGPARPARPRRRDLLSAETGRALIRGPPLLDEKQPHQHEHSTTRTAT